MDFLIKQSDNLEFMQTLESESIDLIYCDILYGTGKNFGDYLDLYPMKEIIDEHYLPRLKEMHRLLKTSGTIYLQMDYRISHWVRLLMDDVFGYGNMLNECVWYYKNGALKAKSKKFRQNTDTIISYCKKKGLHKWNDVFVKCEPYKNSKHKFNSETKKAERLKNENGKIEYFTVEEKKQDNMFEINALNSSEKVNYYSQKPKELLRRIFLSSSDDGDLIADFYLGSGTSAVVSKENNRRFIGCDISEKAVELTNKRLNEILL